MIMPLRTKIPIRDTKPSIAVKLKSLPMIQSPKKPPKAQRLIETNTSKAILICLK